MTDFSAQLQSAAAPLQKEAASEATKTRVNTRRNKKAAPDASTNIEANVFYQVQQANPDPETQKQEFVKLMEYTNQEEAEANAKAFVEFTAFQQLNRKKMALALIDASDTKVFANLQAAIGEINNELLNFNDLIDPFMRILEAVGNIQKAGATTDMIDALRKEDALREEWDAEVSNLNNKISSLRANQNTLDRERSLALEDKPFMGLFGVRKSSLDKAARLKGEAIDIDAEIASTETEIKGIHSRKAQAADFGELNKDKEVLKNMLDLSSEEHQENHLDLLKSARSFIEVTGERVDGTLTQAETMQEQINQLNDMAFTTRQTYSILSEASLEAGDINAAKHAAMEEEYESIKDDSSIKAMKLEKEVNNVAKHVELLSDTRTETTTVLQELTMDSQRIEHMESSNKTMIKSLRRIQTSSTAGVASNLAVTIQGIGQTATQQAMVAADQAINKMNDKTFELGKSQVINSAVNKRDELQALEKNLSVMGEMSEMLSAVKENTADTVAQTRALTDEMAASADDLKESVRELISTPSHIVQDEAGDRA